MKRNSYWSLPFIKKEEYMKENAVRTETTKSATVPIRLSNPDRINYS